MPNNLNIPTQGHIFVFLCQDLDNTSVLYQVNPNLDWSWPSSALQNHRSVICSFCFT